MVTITIFHHAVELKSVKHTKFGYESLQWKRRKLNVEQTQTHIQEN